MTFCAVGAPIDDVRDADTVKFTSIAFDYTVTGASSLMDSISEPNLVDCVAKSPGTLDITIDLANFGAPFSAMMTLTGTEMPNDVVQWDGAIDVNECVTIDLNGTMVTALVRDVEVRLTATATAIAPTADADCSETFNVQLMHTGTNADNFINFVAYGGCIQLPLTEINFSAQNMMFTGLTGAAPSPDLNGDGVVDGADLATLLAQWGTNGSADLNGDGIVNGADLAALLANWS
jgi:hypothetical protein